MTEYSLSDLATATRGNDNDGFCGNGAIWLVLLFLFWGFDVDRKMIELYSIDYDLPTIYLCQNETHEKYAEAEKHIGVDIC